MASKGKDKVDSSEQARVPNQPTFEALESRLAMLEKKVQDLEEVVAALCFEPEDKQPSPKIEPPKGETSKPYPGLGLDDLHHHSSPSYSPGSDGSYGGYY